MANKFESLDCLQFAVAWGPDNKHFITSSADKTVKLCGFYFIHSLSLMCFCDRSDGSNNICAGDAAAQKLVSTWKVGSGAVGDQQVGSAWAGAEDLISLSLDGSLNVYDRRSGHGPTRTLIVR